MKTRLVLQFMTLLLLSATAAEGFFFGHKKALLDFFHYLKGKYEAKKGLTNNNIRHYHVHYYPAPVHVISGKGLLAPEEKDLDHYHKGQLSSLGWSDYGYKYIPDTKITIPKEFGEAWSGSHGPYIIDDDVIETVDDHNHHGLIIQVPIHQQITFHHPPSKKETKSNLLTAFFQKIKHIKEFFEQKKDHKEEKEEDVTFHHKINAYVVYVPPIPTHHIR